MPDKYNNPIIHSLRSQIEPARKAMAARWLYNAELRINRAIAESNGPMVAWSPAWPPNFNPHHRRESKHAYRWFEQTILDLFHKVRLDIPMPFGETTIPAPNWDDDAKRDALEKRVEAYYKPLTHDELVVEANVYANRQWQAYIDKMEDKFEFINAKSVEIVGEDPLWNILKVKAANGVEFTIENRIVDKVSKYGVAFCQFPARFGNVTKNGEPVKFCASQTAVEELTRITR
tara:strand:+ start:874 stop:1569 length:696 start_codon:yes stop_codon:yes gene_type:complete